jgi:hypothetical protein
MLNEEEYLMLGEKICDLMADRDTRGCMVCLSCLLVDICVEYGYNKDVFMHSMSITWDVQSSNKIYKI